MNEPECGFPGSPTGIWGLPPKSAEKVMLTGQGWFPALGAGDTAVLLPTPPVLPRSDLLRRGVPFYFPDGTGPT